jgi:hypothetical protein
VVGVAANGNRLMRAVFGCPLGLGDRMRPCTSVLSFVETCRRMSRVHGPRDARVQVMPGTNLFRASCWLRKEEKDLFVLHHILTTVSTGN